MMELQYKNILAVAFVIATFLPNVMPCWIDEDSSFASEWDENRDMCGTYSNNGKIVGGSDSHTFYWPWLGFLYVNGKLCTAELIAWDWVTTAAHCVDNGV
ncbi:serine protease 40-like [Amphiura filiformis]|uniref:serine protease 40-like n=1 Tax=Amphiura filiformis TaxID=82378 RepID=UPI003B211863